MRKFSVFFVLFIKQLEQDVDEIWYLPDSYDWHKQKSDARNISDTGWLSYHRQMIAEYRNNYELSE